MASAEREKHRGGDELDWGNWRAGGMLVAWGEVARELE